MKDVVSYRAIVAISCISAVVGSLALAEEVRGGGPIRALVVTGGHGYDKPAFEAMFASMSGIAARHAEYPKAAEEFAADRRGHYDVVVFYDMINRITETQQADLVEMLQQGKGVVALHHTLAAHQGWDEYRKIIGGKYYTTPRRKADGTTEPPRSTYRHDVRFRVKVVDKEHPITKGIGDFDIFDEVYKHYDVNPDVHVLLTTDHPENEPTIAWVKEYGPSRVVYIQLGHDPYAYKHPNYRELVARAIRWTSKQPDDRIATPGFQPRAEAVEPPEGPEWIRLFNGKDFDGWEIMGNPGGWQILPGGVIRSEGGKGGNWLRYAGREFGDFILRAEWRVSKGGNSGLFIRARREGNPWETGHEVQVLNDPQRDALHCTGSLYGSVAVNPRPDESPDKWHAFEIHARGEHIIVIVDDVKVIDAKATDHPELKKRPLRGFIGIQDSHTDAGKWVEWRAIRIRPLDK